MKEISITKARHELTSLPGRFKKDPGAVAVTRWGRPVLAVMPWDLYESIVETLEVMGDRELMESLRRALEEEEAEKLVSWEQAKKQLGPCGSPSSIRL